MILYEGIYGYKSVCTKISEFLGRNKDPYNTREIRMKRGIGNEHMRIS